MKSTTLPFLVSYFALSEAATLAGRQSPLGTATVDLETTTGPVAFLGSGFIYGWPDNGTNADSSIPEHFATDIRFNANRAGGAQMEERGWAFGGYDTYIARFNSTLSNYRTTRKFGGDFLLLPHDLWGADGSADEDTPFPGDGGDWTESEAFLGQLIADIKANDMFEGLVMDLWNEPDLDIFWHRSWEQYVEYFIRATKIVRAEMPGTLISGPSSAHSPSLDSETWRVWLSSVAEQDAVPDIYSWHQIGDWEREPDSTVPDLNTLLAEYGLPQRPIDVNEYAWPDEQNPANTVYYLAQLERHNIRGLRAHWGSGSGLHDYMADLIFAADAVYYPNGEWQLYKYYASMGNKRVATKASSDLKFDVFATRSPKAIKVIAGSRTVQAPYDIEISGLSSFGGLKSEGTVQVRTLRFDWEGPGGQVGAPVDLGLSEHSYSEDMVTLRYDPPTNSTAFAFEIARKVSCGP